MQVALVHDYLTQDGGAERVLLALHELFPKAPIFTLFHDPERVHPDFNHATIHTSFLNKWPSAPRHYERYLTLMPHAIETFDLSNFDLILSSSSSFAKGALAAPGALHICYCHTPTRFLWQERIGYITELPQPAIVKWFLPYLLHRMRTWDRLAAERPDIIVTNSHTSQSRILRYYRRETTIIAPPVDVDTIPMSTKPGSYWLAGGRLVSYKRFDLIVKAFANTGLPLKIFGRGPEEKKLHKIAGSRTEFLGSVDESKKITLYQDAIGFINPQIEDFGITAIEAMSAGKPVIANNKGGACETMIDGITGHLIPIQSWQDIGDAIIRFQPERFDAQTIRKHAEQFSKANFQQKMHAFIDQALTTHRGNL